MTPSVGIIMGSKSDLKIAEKAAERLGQLGLGYEITVCSAHRNPEKVREYAKSAESRGLKVIIAGAGLSAALPGVVASYTTLPVIGLPIAAGSLAGVDSLYSIVQMPRGVPVATVGINNAENAAILAAQILALSDKKVKEKLVDLRTTIAQ
ncbi:MAG: 5-(carboxyamino)imidazole ribonucleotide mutase [Candidatus Latescibacteria bacterium]|nr:5-(carboxyamino)imidazole ribonucleotide mutase [Candidatus Latescibacterota bacterium]